MTGYDGDVGLRLGRLGEQHACPIERIAVVFGVWLFAVAACHVCTGQRGPDLQMYRQ